MPAPALPTPTHTPPNESPPAEQFHGHHTKEPAAGGWGFVGKSRGFACCGSARSRPCRPGRRRGPRCSLCIVLTHAAPSCATCPPACLPARPTTCLPARMPACLPPAGGGHRRALRLQLERAAQRRGGVWRGRCGGCRKPAAGRHQVRSLCAQRRPGAAAGRLSVARLHSSADARWMPHRRRRLRCVCNRCRAACPPACLPER